VPAGLSADGTRFDLRFVVHEGPQIIVDHVLVVGNAHTSSTTIERELALPAGTPISQTKLSEAQRRLSALGLFRRVQVMDVPRGTDRRRDVLVVVQEAPLNTIGYGGGLEGSLRTKLDAATGRPVDSFDFAPRGFFEIGRRNLWGKNRSVNLFARGAIRSSDINGVLPTDSTSTITDTSAGFREYRVLAQYREPKLLDAPVDLIVSASVEQAIRSAFDFNRQQIYVEGSHRFGPTVSVAGRYLFGRTRRFNERIDPQSQLDVDRLFPKVRLSTFSASLVRNTRDDAFEPTRGSLMTFDGTLSTRAMGSEIGFVKALFQGFTFKQLPVLRGAVIGGGARLGLGFGFPQLVLDPDGSGQSVNLEQEIPASERFFAGGDSSVRGFALDRLGSAKTLDYYGVSKGGNGLLIVNTELRVPLFSIKGYAVGGATFVDVGNVFARVSDMSLGDLRSGAGFGLRMQLPVGPLRMDFAWKLNPLRFADGTREDRFAWYITLGQAF
jgi:outer membrane protein insertion porin family